MYGNNFMNQHGSASQFHLISRPSSPPINMNLSNMSNEMSSSNIVDCQLQVGNRVYTVQSVVNNCVRVVLDDGLESSLLNLPLDHANQLVDEYNM